MRATERIDEEGSRVRDVDVHDVVIIGSGPAGLTAAIYAARANLQPLILEGEPSSTSDQPGGQLMLTTEVENFPGFPDGILGPELMSRMREQAVRFGADVRMEKVSRVDLSGSPFGVWVGASDTVEPTVRARSVIVATGAQSLLLGLPHEQRLIGHGVSTCATCDGFFFREQDIAVVGGGDSALEEAKFLTKFARSVTIIHRRDSLRASKIMQDRAMANEKIRFLWNRVVDSVVGEESLEGLVLRDVATGALETLPISGLFIAIGHRPSTSLFDGQLDMYDNGYLRTEPGSTRTNVPGVFACGDVQDSTYRQAVTAAGSGCMAAIDAERWLESTAHAS
jgi:thioredoxin reductase (NADPH)